MLMKKQKKKYQELLQKKMQNRLNKIAKDTNIFLKRFIKKQKKTEQIPSMQYGLFSGVKKLS